MKIFFILVALVLFSCACPKIAYVSDKNKMTALEAGIPEMPFWVDGEKCDGTCMQKKPYGKNIFIELLPIGEAVTVTSVCTPELEFNKVFNFIAGSTPKITIPSKNIDQIKKRFWCVFTVYPIISSDMPYDDTRGSFFELAIRVFSEKYETREIPFYEKYNKNYYAIMGKYSKLVGCKKNNSWKFYKNSPVIELGKNKIPCYSLSSLYRFNSVGI